MSRPVPAISVVVLSYRPEEWLAPCLRSALAQGGEVICVDNGSAGAEASEIAHDAGVTVVRSESNLGYAAGVNLGVGRSRGRLLALLNDDAVAPAGWVEAAAAALEDPSVAAVGPRVVMAGWWREVLLADGRHAAPGDHRVLGTKLETVTAGGRDVLERLTGAGVHEPESDGWARWRWTVPATPWYVPAAGPRDTAAVAVNGETVTAGAPLRLCNKAGSYLRSDGVLGDYGDSTPDDGRFDVTRECFFVSGTALVTTRRVWDVVGPLAEPYFAYYEDADWGWRARLMGLRAAVDGGTVVEHRVSATSGGSRREEVRRLATRNRTLTLVRNAPAGVAVRDVGERVTGGAARAPTLRLLPWALATRRRMARSWTTTAEALWEQWAGRDTDWDRSPARR